MPRLTILIPFAGDVEPFETTLASVLQNRPEKCEVLVVHAGSYNDPYDLSGDVQFVEEADGSSVIELLNAGIEEATGEFVHILQPGAEVDEGWTETAIDRFGEPQVGMVSPVLIDGANPDRIAARGIKYSFGGSRQLVGAGSRVSGRTPKNVKVLGPTLSAAFYRHDTLHAIGGFDETIGEEFADVDVALALQALGCECRFAAESCVRFTNRGARQAISFQSGRRAERLFWRHHRRHGGKWALALHPLTVATATLTALPRIGAFTQLLGRTVASLEFGAASRYEQQLNDAIAEFYSDTVETIPLTSKAKPQASASHAARRAA